MRQDFWATPIWCFKVKDKSIDFGKIEQECITENHLDLDGRIASNKNGWQSNFILYNKYTEINKLIEYISKQLPECIKDFGIKKEFSFKIINYWININNKNSSNAPHIHPESLLSCIIYVKAPDNCGNLFFRKDALLTYILDKYCDNSNELNFSSVKYVPEVSKVIIFPSYMEHYVEQNLSDEPRMSISFNIVDSH
jgi:uncharacterized protein (TIGR02466 family)